MRVLITGCSGAIGRRLAAELSSDPRFELVAGIDVRPPANASHQFDFTLADVRDPLDDLLRAKRIDTVIHCAFQLRPLHDTQRMEAVNVGGARSLIRACEASPDVRQIVQLSSATVYGFQRHPAPYVEADPMRPSPEFLYALHKYGVEQLFADLALRRPDMIVTVLRPSLIAGRRGSDPVMNYLRRPLVFLPKGDARLQLTHVDDLATVIRALLLEPRAGVFNVGAPGSVSLPEATRALGSRAVYLPLNILRPLNEAAWRCRLTALAPAPSGALPILRHSWIVDSGKLMRETSFQFTRSSLDTLKELAAS